MCARRPRRPAGDGGETGGGGSCLGTTTANGSGTSPGNALEVNGGLAQGGNTSGLCPASIGKGGYAIVSAM